MTAILVAEADPRISKAIRKGLFAHGYSATAVGDGVSAYTCVRRGNFDLIVLDTRLPLMDGLKVLRRLRAEGCSLPVVLLTARPWAAIPADKLTAANEQFVSRPVRFEELLAAVRRLLSPRPADEPAELVCGDLRLDLRTRQAHVGDYSVDLSSRECALAAMFLRHPGRVLSRSQLLRHVWGDHDEPESNVVDVYVGYLRRKLGAHWFVASRGVGYRLDAALRAGLARSR